MPPAVSVRESRINGRGVFADVDFAAGAVLLDIDDSYVVDDDHSLPRGEEHHCDYLEAGKTVWMQSPERFINHSCDPNVFVRTHDGVRQVIALIRIGAGEEICYDYCVNSSGDVVWQCSCQASRCRHTIHSDFFHLPLELQREYLPLLDEWFLNERSADIERLRDALAAMRSDPSEPLGFSGMA